MSEADKHSGLMQVGTAKKKSKIAIQEHWIGKGKNCWFWLQSYVLWVSTHLCWRGFLLKLLGYHFSSKVAVLSGLLAQLFMQSCPKTFHSKRGGLAKSFSVCSRQPSLFLLKQVGGCSHKSRDGRSKRAVVSGTLKDRKFQMSSLWMFCVSLLMTININDIFLCDGFSSWLTQKKTGHTGWLQSEIVVFHYLLSFPSVFFPSFYFSFLTGC